MKIITYNLWNHPDHRAKRRNLFIKEVAPYTADLIALQEVPSKDFLEGLQKDLGFTNGAFLPYEGDEEGLGLLSNLPIKVLAIGDLTTLNSAFQRYQIELDGLILGLTNLHLDYKKASHREQALLKILSIIEEDPRPYELMLGDFNARPESLLYQFLTGQTSLKDLDANWIDLHLAYEARQGRSPSATLDFINNPRFLSLNSLEAPARFDWLMLKNPYPDPNPRLHQVRLLGQELIDGLTPSDHYGLYLELDFKIASNA